MDNLDKTFGAMFVGAIVGAIVYGITTLQTYFYFLNYTQDGVDMKVIVAAVWLLDTIHVAFVAHAMYHYLVVGYGVPEVLLSGTWSLFASIGINVTIAFISQCFFTKLIHNLGPPKFKWILTSIIMFIVAAHFAFGIETVVQFSIKKEFARLSEVESISVIPFGVAAILSDVMIAAALVILLRKSRSEFEDTNSLIKALTVYAVNRCVLTSMVAVIEVILFVAVPGSLFSFAFDFVIGKLYANSLLASLNSRQALYSRRKRGSTHSGVTSTGFNIASLSTATEVDANPPSIIRMSRIESQSPQFNHLISNDSKVRPAATSSHKRRRSLPTMTV